MNKLLIAALALAAVPMHAGETVAARRELVAGSMEYRSTTTARCTA